MTLETEVTTIPTGMTHTVEGVTRIGRKKSRKFGSMTRRPRNGAQGGKFQRPLDLSRVTTDGAGETRKQSCTNATGGPKWKDVVGRTTVNSDTAEVFDCVGVGPKKGEDFYRAVIKGGAEIPNLQKNVNTSGKGKLAICNKIQPTISRDQISARDCLHGFGASQVKHNSTTKRHGEKGGCEPMEAKHRAFKNCIEVKER